MTETVASTNEHTKDRITVAGRSKIVDEQEALRWIAEGRTYQRIADEYERKYGIRTTPTMWSNLRRRRGLDRRINRDGELIPWAVRREHRWAYPLMMLRVEGRRRAGPEVREVDQKRLIAWLQRLDELNTVVDYDPDTDEGFVLVPREAGDDELIRRPTRGITRRPAAG